MFEKWLCFNLVIVFSDNGNITCHRNRMGTQWDVSTEQDDIWVWKLKSRHNVYPLWYFDCILYFVRLRLVSDSWHLHVYRRGVKPSAEPFATMAVAGRVASRCHSVRGAAAEGQPCPSASSKSSTYIIQNISTYKNSEPVTMNYTRSFKDIQATSSPSSNTLSSICRHQRSY